MYNNVRINLQFLTISEYVKNYIFIVNNKEVLPSRSLYL